MERTQKSWGERINLFQNDLCEVSILHLTPNQRCSWHRHITKFNQFYVISGRIKIKTDYGEALVERGQIFTTKPLEMHEFQTTDMPATVMEIMYVKYDPEDIQREDVGGPLDPDTEAFVDRQKAHAHG